MRDLTWDDFRDSVGTTYSVATEAGALPLRLVAAEPLDGKIRVGGSFRLDLLGPAEPILPQSIYPFAADGVEPFEMFIVPVGRQPDGIRYEAIFY